MCKVSLPHCFMTLFTMLFCFPSVVLADSAPAVLADVNAGGSLSDLFNSLVGNSPVYWSWWLGAIALGILTVSFWWFIRVPMVGSSSWQRIVDWREERQRHLAEKDLHMVTQTNLMKVMMAETIAQFGEASVAQSGQSMGSAGAHEKKFEAVKRAPWQAHITFLVMIGVGGLLASISLGNFDVRFDMGSDFVRLFGDGWVLWLVLFVGGICIGLGTRMAGGCTIGHGLSGLSRFQVGSLIGTGSFMMAAVLVSMLLERLIS